MCSSDLAFTHFLQSVALLYRGATNLAPVVGSALLLASAVPARGTAAWSSAWHAPVVGYLLFPGAFVCAAAPQDVARFNNKGPLAGRHVSVAAPSAAIAERDAVPKFMKSARPAHGQRRLLGLSKPLIRSLFYRILLWRSRGRSRGRSNRGRGARRALAQATVGQPRR